MLRKFLQPHRVQQGFALLHQLLMASYGFLLLFVLVRLMSKEETGRWLLFLSTISISDMLMHGLLQTVVVKEVASNALDNFKTRQIATNAFIPALILFAVVALVAVLSNFICISTNHHFQLLNDYAMWYPCLGLFMILYNVSWWINTGTGNFKRVFIQRLIFCFTSVAYLLICFLITHALNFKDAVLSQLTGFAVSAFISFAFSRNISIAKKYFSLPQIKSFIAYGKYTIGTMLGSSLLRNADTFMIAAFMNTGAVAVYTLAQKIIEVFEVLLRSVAATALPLLHSMRNDMTEFSKNLISRVVSLTLLFIPIAVIVFYFSQEIIQLISGSNNYGLSAQILRVFMVYVLLLPLDRMIGVALEALNLAKLNLIKTTLLVIVNVSGNFIALHYFQSLTMVAATSSVALIIAIALGLYFLRTRVQTVTFKKIFTSSILN